MGGVIEGYILAPYLLNLFMNVLPPTLWEVDGHSPKLGPHFIYLLPYSDVAVVLSHSHRGLKHLLLAFDSYCETNLLSVNYCGLGDVLTGTSLD